jgi:Protein of unknown function (DUF3099)
VGGRIDHGGKPQEGRDLVKRRNQPVLITDAAEDPENEIRRREIRYVIMMLTRALCLLGGAILVVQKPPLWGLWASLCVVGMVLLPWLAVILANDRPPKRRQPVPRNQPPGPPALPATEHRVIDQD